MDQIVEDLDGVKVIMDDVIIAGDESTHDERLQKFLERASKKGLKLNKEKCRIRQKEVPYVGHLLTAEGLKIDPQKIKGNARTREQRRCETAPWLYTVSLYSIYPGYPLWMLP